MAAHPRERRPEDAGGVASHCELMGPGADQIGSRLPRDLRADAPPESTHLLASGDGRHGSPEPCVPATSANTGTARMAAGPGQPQQRRLKYQILLHNQVDNLMADVCHLYRLFQPNQQAQGHQWYTAARLGRPWVPRTDTTTRRVQHQSPKQVREREIVKSTIEHIVQS